MNDADARLLHPWLRINRVLRVMLQTRWSTEAWSQVRVEFKWALVGERGVHELVVRGNDDSAVRHDRGPTLLRHGQWP